MVLGDDEVPEDVRERLLGKAPELGDLLALRNAHAERDHRRARELTVDLVTGDPDSRAAAAEGLLGERVLSDSGRYCAVALGVDPRSTSSRDAEKSALAVSVTTSFVAQSSTASVVGAALPDGLGVLVFPRPVVVPRLTRLLQGPEVIGVRAGIGPLGAIEDVQHSFARARLAWRATCFAPQDHPIVLEWDRAGLDATLARLPLELLKTDDLPPAVRRLLDHGLGIDLLDTLDRYLGSGGDAQQTARMLNIHRSTLYYRLDKVREAIDEDLRDGVLRRELHTGIRMAQLAGLGPWAMDPRPGT
nr:PucR family transcriptional regulator [Nocardioides panzhihuensis]